MKLELTVGRFAVRVGVRAVDSKGNLSMDTPLHMFAMFAVAVFALAFSACGAIHSQVITQPDNIALLKQVIVLPVEFVSKEQTPDALARNAQWKTLASNELRALLVRKNIGESSNGQATVRCRIEVTYGNRAVRDLIGFGAGAGHIRVTMELKDSTGTVRYATTSEADLAAEAHGDDMAQVAPQTIAVAVKELGTHL